MIVISNLLKNRRNLYIVLIILSASIWGCSISNISSGGNQQSFPDDPRVDRSFITGQPCDAPCWYDLKLGESSLEDIRKILPELPFIDKSQIREQSTGSFGPNEKLFLAHCFYSKAMESCVALETSATGKLSKIDMDVDYPLNLQSVIARLDSPMFYTVHPSPDGKICSFNLYWPEKDIIASIHKGPREMYCPDLKNSKIDLQFQVISLIYTRIDDQEFQGNNSLPWPDPTP